VRTAAENSNSKQQWWLFSPSQHRPSAKSFPPIECGNRRVSHGDWLDFGALAPAEH